MIHNQRYNTLSHTGQDKDCQPWGLVIKIHEAVGGWLQPISSMICEKQNQRNDEGSLILPFIPSQGRARSQIGNYIQPKAILASKNPIFCTTVHIGKGTSLYWLPQALCPLLFFQMWLSIARMSRETLVYRSLLLLWQPLMSWYWQMTWWQHRGRVRSVTRVDSFVKKRENDQNSLHHHIGVHVPQGGWWAWAFVLLFSSSKLLIPSQRSKLDS